MNTQGPFLIEPHLTNDFQFPTNQIPVQLLVGQNGLIEFINASGLFLTLSFQSRGSVIQEPFSKVCYKVVPGVFGTQILTVSANTFPSTQVAAINAVYIASSRQVGQSYFWVNIYEEGEIEWYPPLSLNPPPGQTHFVSRGAATGGYTLTIPTTQVWYGDTRNPIAYITGFDLAGNNAATISAGSLTITNLIQQADGSNELFYSITAPADQGYFYSVRFPAPISNLGNPNPITFTVPALGSSFTTLNVYYYLD